MITMDETIMGLVQVGTVKPEDAYAKALDKKRTILDQLERGEITAEEAKAQLKGGTA